MPSTMQIKPLTALYPKVNLIGSPDAFCSNAKHDFKKNLEAGQFNQTKEDGFFVYQIESGLHKHIGLVGLNKVEDFLQGHIKKHEETLSEHELKHKELFLNWKAILKPILVMHTPVPELLHWLNSFAQSHIPIMTVRIKKEETTHRFWSVTNPNDIVYLQKLFAREVTDTYIADGHHRTTTTALLHQSPEIDTTDLDMAHLFCAWFGADQLDILDYNRVVEGVKKIGAGRLVAQLAQIFDIALLDKPRKPSAKHEVVMFLHKQWYALRWRDYVLEMAPNGNETLDTALLNDLVINQLFGIIDVRTDTRISYVEGSKGMEGLQKTTNKKIEDRVGFAFYPVAAEDLMRMADAGESLPPKSTYFEPRLKSGLLVRQLELKK